MQPSSCLLAATRSGPCNYVALQPKMHPCARTLLLQLYRACHPTACQHNNLASAPPPHFHPSSCRPRPSQCVM
jgi:hypothetical protein